MPSSDQPTSPEQLVELTRPPADDEGSSVITRTVTNENGESGVETSCQQNIPEKAASVIEQAVSFDYAINIVSGSSIFLARDHVEKQTREALVAEYLDCQFVDGRDFYTHTFGSLPVDIVSTANTCPSKEIIMPDAECYVVRAVFTVKLFFFEQQRVRKLQASFAATISDPNVFGSFNTSLQAIFDSDDLVQGDINILGLSFLGITNGDNNEFVGTDSDGVVGATNGENKKSLESSQGANPSRILVGVVAGVAVIVALIVALLFYKRRQAKKRFVEIPDEETSDGGYSLEHKAMVPDDNRRSIDIVSICSTGFEVGQISQSADTSGSVYTSGVASEHEVSSFSMETHRRHQQVKDLLLRGESPASVTPDTVYL
jgi:hypothetical protein